MTQFNQRVKNYQRAVRRSDWWEAFWDVAHIAVLVLAMAGILGVMGYTIYSVGP